MITDPMHALLSLQRADRHGPLSFERGRRHPDVLFFVDQAGARMRFNYALRQDADIVGLVMLVGLGVIKGTPLFHMGYVIDPGHRRQGLAKRLVSAALDELTHGLAGASVAAFDVEAVVAVDNHPSNRVAMLCLASTPIPIIDAPSGQPAYHYKRHFRGVSTGAGEGDPAPTARDALS